MADSEKLNKFLKPYVIMTDGIENPYYRQMHDQYRVSWERIGRLRDIHEAIAKGTQAAPESSPDPGGLC